MINKYINKVAWGFSNEQEVMAPDHHVVQGSTVHELANTGMEYLWKATAG